MPNDRRDEYMQVERRNTYYYVAAKMGLTMTDARFLERAGRAWVRWQTWRVLGFPQTNTAEGIRDSVQSILADYPGSEMLGESVQNGGLFVKANGYELNCSGLRNSKRLTK